MNEYEGIEWLYNTHQIYKIYVDTKYAKDILEVGNTKYIMDIKHIDDVMR